MAKFWKLFTVFIICFSLFGCGQQQKPLHLVTKISVTDNKGITRDFTDPQKMETILYYLRSLDPMGRPKTDPERIMGESYRIHIEYADGGQSIYRQRANRFLSKDAHPWQTIDPKKAAILRPLLESIQVTDAKGT
jgi:hypothetical protein